MFESILMIFFFISAMAQPFTVMFSSDNFEGQYGKNGVKNYIHLYVKFITNKYNCCFRTSNKICNGLSWR